MNKKIFLWALYDFANTPLTAAIGGLFLAQWVVLNNHIDEIWYGGVFALSTVLLLVTSPFWGSWSDRIGKRMPFIKWLTVSLLALGVFLGLTATSALPVMLKVVLALILFFFIQYFYQISLIFYDALLLVLSNPKNIGKISGIGETFGELGWLLGPAMLLPFANGAITFFGEPGRGQVFLPAVLVLALFGLPMILLLREPKAEIALEKASFKAVCCKTMQGLKFLIRKDKNVTVFLVAFMLVADAILTGSLYFAIYLDQVYHISDNQKFLFLALLEIFAVLSAYIIGRVSDKLGIKKLLLISCLFLSVTLSLLAFAPPLFVAYALGALVGVGIGGLFTTSRALLINISPVSRICEYFGFYAAFQRFASIIGPLTWGGIVLFLKNYGVIKYQIAMASLVVLVLIGTLLVTKVKEEKTGVNA